MELNDILSEYFSQATKNFSKVSRMWTFTIIAAALTFMFTMSTNSIHPLLLNIVILAVLCILLDGIQYFYTAAKIKKLLDMTTKQEQHKINKVVHGTNSKKNISEEDIKVAMNIIHNTTFKIVFAKFCLLTVSTLLLSLFILIIAK